MADHRYGSKGARTLKLNLPENLVPAPSPLNEQNMAQFIHGE